MVPEAKDGALGAVADDTAVSSPATEVTPGVSTVSPPTDSPKPTLLDVVKAVVEPKAEEPEAVAAPDAESKVAESPVVEAPLTDDQLKELPFHRHPRFKQVVKERSSALSQVSEFQAEVERLKGPAAQYASIEQFMQANKLDANETVRSFKLAALYKNDPEAALNELLPMLVDLRKRTGHELPADVVDDIENGRITEERGLELSRSRAAAALAEARAADVTNAAVAERNTREAGEAHAAIISATEAWDIATRKVDPDFSAKETFIADRARAIVAAEGRPETPAAAVALVKRAYADVTDSMRKLIPAKPALRRANEGYGSMIETSAPKTLLDAITAAARIGA